MAKESNLSQHEQLHELHKSMKKIVTDFENSCLELRKKELAKDDMGMADSGGGDGNMAMGDGNMAMGEGNMAMGEEKMDKSSNPVAIARMAANKAKAKAAPAPAPKPAVEAMGKSNPIAMARMAANKAKAKAAVPKPAIEPAKKGEKKATKDLDLVDKSHVDGMLPGETTEKVGGDEGSGGQIVKGSMKKGEKVAADNADYHQCGNCKGMGSLTEHDSNSRAPGGKQAKTVKCPTCSGTGQGRNKMAKAAPSMGAPKPPGAGGAGAVSAMPKPAAMPKLAGGAMPKAPKTPGLGAGTPQLKAEKPMKKSTDHPETDYDHGCPSCGGDGTHVGSGTYKCHGRPDEDDDGCGSLYHIVAGKAKAGAAPKSKAKPMAKGVMPASIPGGQKAPAMMIAKDKAKLPGVRASVSSTMDKMLAAPPMTKPAGQGVAVGATLTGTPGMHTQGAGIGGVTAPAQGVKTMAERVAARMPQSAATGLKAPPASAKAGPPPIPVSAQKPVSSVFKGEIPMTKSEWRKELGMAPLPAPMKKSEMGNCPLCKATEHRGSCK